MSHENVELARLGYQALNNAFSGDADLGDVVAQMHPDVVVEMGVLEGTWRGCDGVLRFMEGQLETVEGLRMEPEEFIAAGDQVIVSLRLSGRIRSTGLPFEAHYVHLVAFRDGKPARIRLVGSVEKALEAVGLRE